MACLKLSVFVPVKVMSLTIFMSYFVLFSVKTGVCIKQTGTCRPICSGDDCITVNQDSVDFKTAEETCRERNGEFMTFQAEVDESLLGILSQELFGNFWIGLRLPANTCSNLSAPLRGYEWTSVGMHRNFIPSFSTWKDDVKVCTPHCVSFSNDQKWTERLCSDKTDGFLCKTSHKDACQAQELSDPNVFKSSKGCSDGPCEHTCTEVKGGYRCSCFDGYIPNPMNPKQCQIHCAEEKCPALCDSLDVCFCPDGYIIDGEFCEDIDECWMQQCEQGCNNTFGGYFCSCQEGYTLKDEVECIELEGSQHSDDNPKIITAFVKPTADITTRKVSSASAGSFLIQICSFVAVAVGMFTCVVRFYVVKRQKRREQSSSQRSAALLDETAC